MTPSPSVAPTGPNAGAQALVAELKTRARLRLNASRKADAHAAAHAAAEAAPADPRLRDCLTLVSRELGFQNWDQARRVLGGGAVRGDDLGAFWHAPRCNGLLSHWFASHEQAREALAAGSHRVLLPYRRQFVVVDEHYLRELGLAIDDPAWGPMGRDPVAGYGSAGWVSLCRRRLAATRGDA